MNRRDDDEARDEPPVEWHNKTSTLLGASVAGLLAIALVVVLISYVARQFSEPEQAPLNYIPPPASSASATRSATSTTTGTITSTSPPITSDINPGETTTTSESTTRPSTRPPRTRETDADEGDEGEEDETTTRSRPRTNVTRTLYPGT
ncbi:hypothetical protein [Mycolicibacterium sp. BiH015]|uniref:hypothetical protein n=1 Tax=Mycolicibacterium sp. BiH015 TaxID=3018808 RepID=UPI002FD93244